MEAYIYALFFGPRPRYSDLVDRVQVEKKVLFLKLSINRAIGELICSYDYELLRSIGLFQNRYDFIVMSHCFEKMI